MLTASLTGELHGSHNEDGGIPSTLPDKVTYDSVLVYPILDGLAENRGGIHPRYALLRALSCAVPQTCVGGPAVPRRYSPGRVHPYLASRVQGCDATMRVRRNFPGMTTDLRPPLSPGTRDLLLRTTSTEKEGSHAPLRRPLAYLL